MTTNTKDDKMGEYEEKSCIELDRLKLAQIEDSPQEILFRQNELIENKNRIKWKDALPQVYI